MLEYDQQWELEDERTPLDQHTLNILVAMSNTIRPAIQMEGDCGSRNKDGCIPVLDLKMNTVLIRHPADSEEPEYTYYQVTFKFYKKPMARPTIMHAKTAMTDKMKRETTSNELMRRFLNTSQGLPNTEADMEEATNRYMIEMRNSGYSAQYRYDTLVNTIRGFRRKLQQDSEGVKPLYREGHVGARERHMSKISASSKWFRKTRSTDNLEEMGRPTVRRNPWRKGGHTGGDNSDTREVENVTFLPHTGGSSLQKLLQRTDDKVTRALGMPRTRYIEKGGLTLKDLLVRKDPWFAIKGGCDRPTCHICKSQGGKGTSCRREGACYRIDCVKCEKGEEEGLEGVRKTSYIGETSRSCFGAHVALRPQEEW